MDAYTVANMSEETRPVDRFVRWRDVRMMIPVSEPVVRRMMREGKFPQARKIYGKTTGWFESEILAWMRSRECSNFDQRHALPGGEK